MKFSAINIFKFKMFELNEYLKKLFDFLAIVNCAKNIENYS